MEHRNPLHVLGQGYSWADYAVFKAHLRLPSPYPLLALKHYPRPSDAIPALSELLEQHFDYAWEKQKMSASLTKKRYAAAHIPPQYHVVGGYTATSKKNQQEFAQIVDHAELLKDSGVVLYLHSAFASSAMHAACAVLRNTLDKGLRGYCANFPTVLEAIKKWDPDDNVVTRIHTSDVLVLWAIGSEYATEFTNTHLENLLSLRTANNKATLLVSSLDPKEYKTRYGSEPPGAVVEFADQKMKQTLEEIRKGLGIG